MPSKIVWNGRWTMEVYLRTPDLWRGHLLRDNEHTDTITAPDLESLTARARSSMSGRTVRQPDALLLDGDRAAHQVDGQPSTLPPILTHQEPRAQLEREVVERELHLLAMHVPQAARTIRALLTYIDALHPPQ